MLGCILVTRGQLEYEWNHLMAKLEGRDRGRWEALRGVSRPRPNPLFRVVPGRVESWERTADVVPRPRSAARAR